MPELGCPREADWGGRDTTATTPPSIQLLVPAQHHQESITSRGAAGKQPLCYHLIKETSKWLQRHFITTFPAGPISGCPGGRAARCSPGCGTAVGANPLPGVFEAKKAGRGFANSGTEAAVMFRCGSWTCSATRRWIGSPQPRRPREQRHKGGLAGSSLRRALREPGTARSNHLK